jgi:porin
VGGVKVSCILERLLLAISMALCGPAISWAADGAAQDANSPPPLPTYLRRLTDWNGQRSRLEQAGLKFTFTYYGDAFANPVGGVKQGLGYFGRFGTIIDGDLEKLVGWSGATFHASIHQIHETDFDVRNLDNLMTVSGIGIGYPVSTRLFNLWIEQNLPNQINVRIGQFSAAQEFLVSQNANLFVNSTFGWPVLNAQDLPSGGPAYPEATPGARVQFTPNDHLTVRAAVFDGDPAGPGNGSPVQRDPFGSAFRVNDPPFVIAELAYAYGQNQTGPGGGNPNQEGYSLVNVAPRVPASDLPGTVKIGVWLHTGSFSDELLNAQGGLLSVSGGPPLEHGGNYAVYGVVDQMLWRPAGNGDHGLSLFVRGTAAPRDRNLIDAYADAGLTFKGPLSFRPDDTIGLAFAFARISPQAAASDAATIAVTGQPMPIRDFESAIELTYQWKLSENWFIQPDLQYIIHPGGNVPNPLAPAPASAIPNALVVGARMILKF